MNSYLLSYLALDIARERSRDAERSWLESQDWLELPRTGPSQGTRLRRLIARLLASVSRGFASIVRRLDSHVADDLGRGLAPAE